MSLTVPVPDWEQIVLATPDGVVITNPQFSVAYVNLAFERMSGFSRAEWVGRFLQIAESARDTVLTMSDWGRQARTSDGWTVDTPLRRKDGETCLLQANVVPIRSGVNDSLSGYVWFVRDITRHHSSEQQMIDRLIESETAQEAAFFLMGLLAEHRKPGVSQHLRRLQSFTALLLGALQGGSRPEYRMDREDLKRIIRASVIHDIGDVGMPEGIRLEPGRLTPEELAILKLQPLIGGDVLKRWESGISGESGNAGRMYEVVRDIVLYHHECWDGSGYPYGLAGEEIPLAARVVGLADVYDALTSRHLHRRAWPHSRAANYIMQQAGTKFDPVIVDAFRAVQDQFQWVARHVGAEPDDSRVQFPHGVNVAEKQEQKRTLQGC